MTWSPRRPREEPPPIVVSEPEPAALATPSPATKACLKCAERVLADAQVCRYCRHEFVRQRHWYDRWKWAGAVLAAILAVAYFTGGLDEPLSSLGLNTQTCAENLFGNRMCGDELVAFCEDNYNPGANGDTCDTVLTDAGVDLDQIVADKRTDQRIYERCIDDAIKKGGTGSDCSLP
jgi:hypothetical protein